MKPAPLAGTVCRHTVHGIDFEEAKGLWEDEDRLLIPAKSDTESRFAMLAEYRQRVWVAFFTLQQRVRIIFVRRARPNEREAYEGRRTG